MGRLQEVENRQFVMSVILAVFQKSFVQEKMAMTPSSLSGFGLCEKLASSNLFTW